MRRRSLLLALLATAGIVAPAPVASASGSCTLLHPTKVVIDAPEIEIPMRLAEDCGENYTAFAEWSYARIPWVQFSGWHYYFEFLPPAPPEPFSIDWSEVRHVADSDPIGFYQGYPRGAESGDGTPLTQNVWTVTIKYGAELSRTVVTSSRSTLTLAGRSTSWSPKTHGWYPRAGATVSLWFRAAGASTWRWLRNTTTSSTGRVSFTVTRPPYGDYRLGIKETETVWKSYSTAVRSKR